MTGSIDVGSSYRRARDGDEVTVQRLVEDAPTLVLHGEHLSMANEETTERLVSSLRNADSTVRVVPENGHASNIDNPAFFTSALREFLTERVYPDLTENDGDPADIEGSP